MPMPLIESITLERDASIPDKKLANDTSRIRRRFLRGEWVNTTETALVNVAIGNMRKIGFKFERAADAPEWRLTNPDFVPKPKAAGPRKSAAKKVPAKKASARKATKATKSRKARAQAAPVAKRRAARTPGAAPAARQRVIDLRPGQELVVQMIRLNGVDSLQVELSDGQRTFVGQLAQS